MASDLIGSVRKTIRFNTEIKGKHHVLDLQGLFSVADERPSLVAADVCTSQLLEVKKIFVLHFVQIVNIRVNLWMFKAEFFIFLATENLSLSS